MSKKEYVASRTCNITTKDNPEQTELARLIRDSDTKIIFCTGNAGSGKTFITIYTAYNLVKQRKYAKILYSRDAVQLGAELGFLKGDLNDKFDPFMACLYDNLESIERLGGPIVGEINAKIEKTPITFLRGRNIDNAILIVDEAQNLDAAALKAILTRMSDYSKVILLGSMNQIDNKVQLNKRNRTGKCDFEEVMERLADLPYVGSVELIQSKRSVFCSEIDERLKDL